MGFLGGFFGFFWVGFLLPTLAEGGAHGGERVPLPQQRRRHAALPRVPALSVAHPSYLGQGRPSRPTQGTFRSNEHVFCQSISFWAREKFTCQCFSGISRKTPWWRRFERKLHYSVWKGWDAERGADMLQLLVDTPWHKQSSLYFL